MRTHVTLDHRGLAYASDRVGTGMFVSSTPAAVDVETGEVVWETGLATSVQGFPITFRVDGRRYIAVPMGLGGGSPRVVPSLIAPDIRHPSTGNALYVFALPEN